ncbi:TPA: putative bifunctional diguanylate cyclase/phosphodiesterase [Pseudomonas aeruginosa]
MGIALAPQHADSGELLLARADMALYVAKAAGKGTWRVFSDEMEKDIQEREWLQEHLRVALQADDQLFVFYQPIVDVDDIQRVNAREALLRWRHPDKGWISPSVFIPVAEQSDLIDELGRFVLTRACLEAASWTDGACIAVNASAAQIGKGVLIPSVVAALSVSGLPACRLEIEITETALFNETIDTVSDLQELRALGVRLALDDFGTGYSSLAHLRTFNFDKIKIDGSFVQDVLDRPDCAAVVGAIADIGRRLGVATVAEGVETREHLERVRREGCEEVQGYLLGRPMPNERDALVIARLNRPTTDLQVRSTSKSNAGTTPGSGTHG